MLLFFQLNLISKIISKHHTPSMSASGSRGPLLSETPLGLTDWHFLSYVLETDKKSCLTIVWAVYSQKRNSH